MGLEEMELIENQQLPFKYDWKLQAYLPGTVRLGVPNSYRSSDGARSFQGRRIIPIKPPVAVLRGKNLIVTVGKQQVGDMLIDTAGYDTGLTYCAIGTDDTAPAVGQTQLVDEGGGAAMRDIITSKSRLVNVLTLSTFFASADCSIFIKEAAIFGHSTAGAAENSGIMWSRWLVSFDNTGALYDITITYILTIG